MTAALAPRLRLEPEEAREASSPQGEGATLRRREHAERSEASNIGAT